MDFEPSDRAKDFRERLRAFLDERVHPAEQVYLEQVRGADTPHVHPPIMEEIKEEARRRGLWNLFLPDPEHGAGLSNVEYAPLAELLGRTFIGSEACNCSAPDTGNMEVLHQFGNDEQKERWLTPLLDGEIRSGFAMTEPDVASSDATNIALRIERDGGDFVLNGRKWWTTGVMHPRCRILIVMGKRALEAPVYAQQSMVLVPLGTPGLEIVRSLPVFGYMDPEGHGELKFTDVRVPQANLIAGSGAGFLIAQARLGPGRIHHCMRAVGAAERALELMCKRADERETFGKPVSTRSNIRDWIAEARIELEMLRLFVLKTAWLVDKVGGKNARIEVAGIKVAAPNVALKIIDRAIQVHGGAGVSDDFPLASMYAHARTLRIADGPDAVHVRSVARMELGKYVQRSS